MWGRSAEPGDWVRATSKVPTGLFDDVIGGGLPVGSRGVVTGRAGRWLTVDFDDGLGTTTTRIKDSQCRIDRRGGGQRRFHNRTRRIAIIRLALACFLLWPVVQFFIVYAWHNRTLDGSVSALTIALLDSLGETTGQFITDPLRTMLYLGFLALLGRLAFRR